MFVGELEFSDIPIDTESKLGENPPLVGPENSEIGRRLLEPSYNFKKSIEHETHQLCSVNRPILVNKCFNKCPVKLSAF